MVSVALDVLLAFATRQLTVLPCISCDAERKHFRFLLETWRKTGKIRGYLSRPFQSTCCAFVSVIVRGELTRFSRSR